MRAGDLRVEARQLVEIARALSYGARFIILDEPTAQLDGEEIKRLFVRMRELQGQGVTFLFISHHLQEVYEVCQAVTVLRDARHIVSAPVAELPKDALIEAMTGERVNFGFSDAAGPDGARRRGRWRSRSTISPARTSATSASRCAAARWWASPGPPAAAGSGSPRRSPGSGATPPATSASTGEPLPSGDVPAALALGVGCVPKSRHDQGLVLSAVGRRQHHDDHFRPARLAAASSRRSGKTEKTRAAIRDLGVVTEGPDQPVSSLSGGNQQKVVMGRALANDPSVLVLMDPTAGVDVKSKEALLAVVERMRREGQGDPGRQRRARGSAHLRPGAGDAARRHRGGTQGGMERQRAGRLDRRNMSVRQRQRAVP